MQTASDKPRGVKRNLAVSIALFAAAFIVFGQTVSYDFINYDDPLYVTENPHVVDGLTWEGVKWALGAQLFFESRNADYWIPLTFLSHMLAFEISGFDPWAHHLINVLLHAINGVLLFHVLRIMTGAFRRSAFVAAMFLLHPLHVESVAWVTERKDVLSAFFWFLTMLAYARYVKAASLKRYTIVAGTLALGLTAKPIVVTLPFVLLLLDWWPLGRCKINVAFVPEIASNSIETEGKSTRLSPGRLVLEKAPLFIPVAMACATTLSAQLDAETIELMKETPLMFKIANAFVIYLAYIGKMLYPSGLAVHYPPAGVHLPIWQAVVAASIIAVITWLAIRAGRPYLIVGWLWYLGTLFPVIGLVDTGRAVMADRHTYVPLVGLFMMIAWGARELVAGSQIRSTALKSCACAVIVATGACAWMQVRLWRDSLTLFQHALDVTAGNYVMHANLGGTLSDKGRFDEAVAHFAEALRIEPGDWVVYKNWGNSLVRQGRLEEALDRYLRALHIVPNNGDLHDNVGSVLAGLKRYDEAVSHYSQALRARPDFAEAHSNLGIALIHLGKLREAVDHFSAALGIKPDLADAHFNLGFALAGMGKDVEAISHYSEAVLIRHDFAEAHNNLGVALMRMGRLREAIGHYSEALRTKPDFADARRNLQLVLRMPEHNMSAGSGR